MKTRKILTNKSNTMLSRQLRQPKNREMVGKKRFGKPKILFGATTEDFLKNMFSMLIEIRFVKKPRFIKA